MSTMEGFTERGPRRGDSLDEARRRDRVRLLRRIAADRERAGQARDARADERWGDAGPAGAEPAEHDARSAEWLAMTRARVQEREDGKPDRGDTAPEHEPRQPWAATAGLRRTRHSTPTAETRRPGEAEDGDGVARRQGVEDGDGPPSGGGGAAPPAEPPDAGPEPARPWVATAGLHPRRRR